MNTKTKSRNMDDVQDQLNYYDFVLDSLLNVSEFGDAKHYETLRDITSKREALERTSDTHSSRNNPNRKQHLKKQKNPDDDEARIAANRKKAEKIREQVNSAQYRNEAIIDCYHRIQKDIPTKNPVLETKKLVEEPKENSFSKSLNEVERKNTREEVLKRPNRKRCNVLVNALNYKKELAKNTELEEQIIQNPVENHDALRTEDEIFSPRNVKTTMVTLEPSSEESVDVTEQFKFLLVDSEQESSENTNEEEEFFGDFFSDSEFATHSSVTSSYTTASSGLEREREKKNTPRRRLYKACPNLLNHPPNQKPWNYSPNSQSEKLPKYTISDYPPLP